MPASNHGFAQLCLSTCIVRFTSDPDRINLTCLRLIDRKCKPPLPVRLWAAMSRVRADEKSEPATGNFT
jgi:hypothetical protein